MNPTKQAVIMLSANELIELSTHEEVIERGLKTFQEVGTALLSIRDGRLYREHFGTFEEYCQSRWGFTDRRARMLMSAAEVMSNLRTGTMVPELPNGERQVRPLTRLEPEVQRVAWQTAVETAPNGKVTAAHVEAVVQQYTQPTPMLKDSKLVTGPIGNYWQTGDTKQCAKCNQLWAANLDYCPYCNISPSARIMFAEKERKGFPKIAVHFSSETPEHYTPQIIIDAVLDCLDFIDLDPCSNSKNAPSIPANFHYTVDDDGLSLPWVGKVYMNPPYGRVMEDWVEKLVESHTSGDVVEAIALVPSRTDTQWWLKLRDYPVCLVEGRLKFGDAENSAPFPSAAFYLGDNVNKFCLSFSHLGDIWQRIKTER